MRKLLFSLLGSSLLLSATNTATAAPFVELQTNLGTITLELRSDKAPVTVENFLKYVNSGFYKNVLFHRLVKNFVLQGGGFNKPDGKIKPTLGGIPNEANNGLSNLSGTIAMARTSDPNSATAQFFINLKDNTFLDYSAPTATSAGSAGYAVFGSVLSYSMPLVRTIENFAVYGDVPGYMNVSGTQTGHGDVPFSPNTGLVYIDAAYASDVLDPVQSVTRISLEGAGKVVSTPAGINCGVSCSLSQNIGTALTLTATASAGYYFSGWRGDCKGFRRTLRIDTTRGNHNCTAIFNPLGAVTQ
jgi:peptidyl-prolyl cis-trans isomerase A (cyclophilin A)/peptidyl-prolyl cis-trans isomerase B (cyclophilin B)